MRKLIRKSEYLKYKNIGDIHAVNEQKNTSGIESAMNELKQSNDRLEAAFCAIKDLMTIAIRQSEELSKRAETGNLGSIEDGIKTFVDTFCILDESQSTRLSDLMDQYVVHLNGKYKLCKMDELWNSILKMYPSTSIIYELYGFVINGIAINKLFL